MHKHHIPDKTRQRLKGGKAEEDFTDSKVNSDTAENNNNNNKIKNPCRVLFTKTHGTHSLKETLKLFLKLRFPLLRVHTQAEGRKAEFGILKIYMLFSTVLAVFLFYTPASCSCKIRLSFHRILLWVKGRTAVNSIISWQYLVFFFDDFSIRCFSF